MPDGTVEAATLAQHGPPPLTRSPVSSAVPITPVDRPRCVVGCFPRSCCLPRTPAGRRPQLPFRGLLRLHSRYGPSIRSPAQGDVCRRASILPVARPHRLPATGPTDHCPGGTCTHKVIAPFGDAPEFHGEGLVGAAHQDCAQASALVREAPFAFLRATPCELRETPCRTWLLCRDLHRSAARWAEFSSPATSSHPPRL